MHYRRYTIVRSCLLVIGLMAVGSALMTAHGITSGKAATAGIDLALVFVLFYAALLSRDLVEAYSRKYSAAQLQPDLNEPVAIELAFPDGPLRNFRIGRTQSARPSARKSNRPPVTETIVPSPAATTK